jgi:hypothetical protein
MTSPNKIYLGLFRRAAIGSMQVMVCHPNRRQWYLCPCSARSRPHRRKRKKKPFDQTIRSDGGSENQAERLPWGLLGMTVVVLHRTSWRIAVL